MTFVRAGAAALLASLALAAPAAAAGPLSPGQLDLTFSGDGVLRSGFGIGSEAFAAQLLPLSSGKLAVLTAPTRVVRLRARGRRDQGFGRDGVSRPDAVSWARIAETPDGALILAGVTSGDTILVQRLGRDGRRDTTFGTRGRVRSKWGAFLEGSDVVVTPDGAVLVAAQASAPPAPTRLLVLAYDPAGQPLAGFGVDGVAQLELGTSSFSSKSRLFRLPDGRLRYVSDAFDGRRVRLGGLTADGRPDTAVGATGVRSIASPVAPDLGGIALDARGRFILTGRRAGRLVADALTADGAQVPRYGDGDVARVRFPFRFGVGESAALPGGRVAVALPRLWRSRHQGAVALLSPRGRAVRAFGGRRFAMVGGFSRRRRAHLDLPAIDRLGRLVIGGHSGDGPSDIREDFGRDFVALARIRLRSPVLGISGRATLTPRGVLLLPVRCRAASTCQAALSVRRTRVSVRVRPGVVRVVPIRLGSWARRRTSVRVAATLVGGGRPIEPVALRVRLRRTG